MVMDFEKGGDLGLVEVHRWSGAEWELKEELTGEGCINDTACAYNNGGDVDGGPWVNYDRHGGEIDILERNAFTEMGINVTKLLNNGSETPIPTP